MRRHHSAAVRRGWVGVGLHLEEIGSAVVVTNRVDMDGGDGGGGGGGGGAGRSSRGRWRAGPVAFRTERLSRRKAAHSPQRDPACQEVASLALYQPLRSQAMLWLRQALLDTALQGGSCKEREERVRKGQPPSGCQASRFAPGEMLAAGHSGPLVPNLEKGALLPNTSHQGS